MATNAKINLSIDGVQSVVAGLRQVSERVKDVSSGMAGLTAIGGSLSIGAFAHIIRGAIDAADNLNDLSKTTKIAVADLGGLKLAAIQSGSDLESIAKSINKLSVNMGKDAEKFAKIGVTAKDPIEALKQLSDVFRQVEDPQLRAALGAEALGKQWEGAAPLLSEGGQKIGEMISKGRALAGVTQEMADRADEFNDKLAEFQIASQGAKMTLANDLLPALTDVTKAMVDSYEEAGKLKAAWVGLGALGAFLFTDEFDSVPKKIKAVEEELAKLKQEKEQAQATPFAGIITRWLFGDGDYEKKIADAEKRLADLRTQMNAPAKKEEETPDQKEIKRLNAQIKSFLEGPESAAKRDAAIKKSDEFVKHIQRETAEIGVSTEKKKNFEAQQIASTMKKAGVDQATINAFLALAAKESAALEKRQDEFKRQQELEAIRASKVNDLVASLDREAEAGYNVGVMAKEYAETIDDQNKLFELEASLMGKSNVERDIAIEQFKIELDLQKKIQEIKKELASDEDTQAAIARATEAAARAKAGVANKAVYDEWKRTADDIDSSLTDALMRGFENGKDFAENFRDTLINMFKTLVLRPVISAVLNPISGGIAAMLTGGMAQAAGTGGSSALSSLGTAASIASLFGSGGMTGALMGGAGWLTGATSFTGALSGAGALIGTGSASGIASGLAVGAGALGPLLLGGLALNALYNSFQGETRGGGQYGYSFNGSAMNNRRGSSVAAAPGTVAFLEGPSGGEIAGADVRAAIAGTVQTINQLLKGAGSTAALVGFQAGLETSDKGRGGVFAGGQLSTGAAFGESGAGDNYAGTLFERFSSQSPDAKTALENFSLDLKQATIQALQAATDIPKAIGDQLKNVDAESLSDEAATKLLTSISNEIDAVNAFRDAIAALPFDNLKDLSFDAADALLKLTGGVQNLQTAVSFFAQNFYTDAEKLDAVTEAVTDQLDALGYSSITTKEQFRDVVESLDLTTEAGQKAYASLLQLAPAFVQMVDGMAKAQEEAAKALAEQQQEAARAAKELADQQTRAVEDARSAVEAAYNREAAAFENAIAQFQEFAKSLKDFSQSLLTGDLSTLSPEQKYQALKDEFQRTYSLALAGDPDAMGKLQDVSQRFLSSSRDYYGSGEAYARDFEMVRNAVEKSSAAAASQTAIAQQQLQQLQKQVDGIIEVNKSVLSVRDALIAFFQARTTATAAGVSTPGGNPAFDPIRQYGAQYGDDAYYFIEGINDYSAKLAAAQQAAALTGESVAQVFAAQGHSQEYWQAVQAAIEAGQHPTTSSIKDIWLNGSHANGLDFVPFDGYRAELHRGERVQTAAQARASDEVANLMRQVLAELRADKVQRGAGITAQLDKLDELKESNERARRRQAALEAS